MRQLLLQEISDFLSDNLAYFPTSVAAPSDIFEAYVWTLGIDAARRAGATVGYFDMDHTPVHDLVFRTSPSSIYLPGAFTHAEICFSGCPLLEAHIGIYVAGKSGVVHECDVAILDQAEANTCRLKNVHPRQSKVILAVECKFYSTNLRIDLGRSFLGLTEEIHRENRYFVANTTSKNVEKMLTKHGREWETGVTPEHKKNQNRLRALFERTFKRYKAINR